MIYFLAVSINILKLIVLSISKFKEPTLESRELGLPYCMISFIVKLYLLNIKIKYFTVLNYI